MLPLTAGPQNHSTRWCPRTHFRRKIFIWWATISVQWFLHPHFSFLIDASALSWLWQQNGIVSSSEDGELQDRVPIQYVSAGFSSLSRRAWFLHSVSSHNAGYASFSCAQGGAYGRSAPVQHGCSFLASDVFTFHRLMLCQGASLHQERIVSFTRM